MVAITTCIFVIISKNPVVSVLFLIILFLIMSGYLMVLGINFIALSYILVYVGAVSILFLFILMLINIRMSELTNNTNSSFILAILVLCILYMNTENIIQGTLKGEFYNKISLKMVTSNYWDNNLLQISHINAIGNILYTNYFIWLILSCIILLLAMVGAIIITFNNTSTSKVKNIK